MTLFQAKLKVWNNGVMRMKRAIIICVAVICAISLSACGKADEIPPKQGTEERISEDQQPEGSIEEELSTPAPVEEEISPSQELKEAESEQESKQKQWQMYIQPDMPEPYIEVLKQYEQAMNAGVEDFNDEEVMDRFNWIDGEWRYLYDLYCRRLAWDVNHNEMDDNYRYSLKDLTGDGFPELILGYYLDSLDKTTPEVVYYYSETEGIKMECLSDYYTMTLYQGGIIEYISGGVMYTKTYLQFQEETESWELAVRVVVDWDSDTDSDRGYYWGDDVGGYLTDNELMSEEEYQKIMAQYTAEPVELEWTSLVISVEPGDSYFFPQGAASYVYMATFADLGPQQEEKEVVLLLHVTEVRSFEQGTLYELNIDSDVEAPDTHAGYRGDWRDFGLFYVQGDEVYFIRADGVKRDYQTVEEILNAGTLVCNEAGVEDVLDEGEKGWHEFILVDGDRREYHGYSTLVDTGYYEHFYWEKGKGLVTYESGYGAEADGIEMHLAE